LPLLAAAGDKLSGYYTEEEVRTLNAPEVGDQVIIRKSWYAGDRMMKDEEWKGKTIARFDKGMIYQLDSNTKSYIEISTAFLQKHASEGLKQFGIADGKGNITFPPDLLMRTESTKRIAKWNCYQVMTNPKYRTPDGAYLVLWYSDEVDFPVDVYGDQLKQMFGNSEEAEQYFSRIKQFEGYPVRTEAHGTSKTVVTTLMKIERKDDIDPKLFEIPDDYRGVPLPEDNPVEAGQR